VKLALKYTSESFGRIRDGPMSIGEVKNAWRYTSIHLIGLHGVVLNQAGDKSSWCCA